MSGTVVLMGTGVPVGTHQNLKIFGTAGYRVPARRIFLGTEGYWVPAKFSTIPTPAYSEQSNIWKLKLLKRLTEDLDERLTYFLVRVRKFVDNFVNSQAIGLDS